MMFARRQRVLGLSIEDRSIGCVELLRGTPARSARAARFDLPPTLGYDQPAELGSALASFLRERGFSARRAVVGLPARWLITLDREVPPTSPEQGLAMLRLQAERYSSGTAGEMVFDVLGSVGGNELARVVLVGTPRQRLDQVVAMLQSAGIETSWVSATGLVAAGQLAAPDDAPLLLSGVGSAELVLRRGGVATGLRHLSVVGGGEYASSLATELRRTLALLTPNQRGSPTHLLVMDDTAEASLGGDLAGRLGISVLPASPLRSELPTLVRSAANGRAGTLSGSSLLSACSLAQAAIEERSPPVDFLHSRLAVPVERRLSSRAVLLVAVALAIVGSAVALYTIANRREAAAAELRQRLRQLEPEIKAAETTIDRYNYGRSYVETRPPVLQCLREIAMAFGETEAIWTTSFTFRDNRRGQLQGKAAEQRTVLAVLDRLKANPRFTSVQLQDLREAGGRSRDVAFSISFTYVSGDTAP